MAWPGRTTCSPLGQYDLWSGGRSVAARPADWSAAMAGTRPAQPAYSSARRRSIGTSDQSSASVKPLHGRPSPRSTGREGFNLRVISYVYRALLCANNPLKQELFNFTHFLTFSVIYRDTIRMPGIGLGNKFVSRTSTAVF